jgi:hypothetical protein
VVADGDPVDGPLRLIAVAHNRIGRREGMSIGEEQPAHRIFGFPALHQVHNSPTKCPKKAGNGVRSGVRTAGAIARSQDHPIGVEPQAEKSRPR